MDRPPPSFALHVGRAIAVARRGLGMTQEELAERLNTAARNVQRIEAGQNVTVNTLARIAGALGVRVADLVTDAAAVPRRSARLANPAGLEKRKRKQRPRAT